MGVTIHYAGHLKEPAAFSLLMDELRDFAEQHGWLHRSVAQIGVTLNRWDDAGREWTVTGDTRGIELLPHEDCEPLTFEFDHDDFVQDHTKTQYAPPGIHVAVIELFRRLAPFFAELSVDDEGEYWNTSDPKRLDELLQECFQALDAALVERPKARGPVRLRNGRIADVVE